MIEIIEIKNKKARIEHICMFCEGKINKGGEYEYSRLKYEGDLYVWKTHLKCRDLAIELEMYDDGEGVDGQRFSEFIDEYFSENMSEDKWEECSLCGEDAVDKAIEILKGKKNEL